MESGVPKLGKEKKRKKEKERELDYPSTHAAKTEIFGIVPHHEVVGFLVNQ